MFKNVVQKVFRKRLVSNHSFCSELLIDKRVVNVCNCNWYLDVTQKMKTFQGITADGT